MDWIRLAKWLEKEGGWSEGVELPEGKIVDMEDGYNYLDIPQANGNNDKNTKGQSSQISPEDKTGAEKPREQ